MRWMALFVPLLSAACVYEVPMDEDAAAGLTSLAADRAAPRLALAEHLLGEYFSSDIAAPPTVCLAVSDGRSEEALSPEDETQLIARFPRLAPFARCSWNAAGWRDTESEEPALVFTIHSFTCAGETQCSGWASYTAGAAASPSALYRMSYTAGRWSTARDQRLIMD